MKFEQTELGLWVPITNPDPKWVQWGSIWAPMYTYTSSKIDFNESPPIRLISKYSIEARATGHDTGTTITNLPPGSYTVSYNFVE